MYCFRLALFDRNMQLKAALDRYKKGDDKENMNYLHLILKIE